MEKGRIIQLTNCHIIRDRQILKDDLWIRNGKIINPEPIFYTERKQADLRIDCQGMLIAPGYIDLQVNGKFSSC